ncbi:MAG: hypothetical protein P9X27_00055 [Candidatus Kaelpia aquatica]|nr:hypothetical protein [Candidatus Kaelpia aquatica]
MNDNIKIVIYSTVTVLTILSLVSAFWLGTENRKIYSSYVEEKALWHQKNRDLEFELDKFKIEVEDIRTQLTAYRSQMAKLEENKLLTEEELEELADDNNRLKDEAARLVREREDLKERLTKRVKAEDGRGDDFWSNLLREKTSLELKLSNLKRLLEKKDEEILRFEDERERLSQLTGELLDEKKGLEERLAETRGIVSSFSQSLEQEKEEKLESIRGLERLEQDKQGLALQLEQAQVDKMATEKRLDDFKQTMLKEEQSKNRFEKRIGYVNQILEDKMLEVTRLKQDLEMALEEIKKMGYDDQEFAVELPRIEVGDNSIQAKVVAVNAADGFIVIDRGRRDGVEEGMECFIYREGRLIAKLKVKEVREVTSAAEFLLSLPQESVAKNDVVEFSGN